MQVHADRLVLHSCVQRLKNTYPNCAVTGSERILKIPFLPDVAAGVENAAKGMLQTLRIVCLAANLNVSQEAKQRSSPVGSPPSVCVIQSAISCVRETLRHIPNQIKPHLLRFEMSRLNPSDRFDIGSNALFDPMMIIVHSRKSQVNHFMGQHPVRRKLGRRSLVADAYGDSPSSISKLPTVPDASSFERSDPNQGLRHRTEAVIRRHTLSSRFDPAKNILYRHAQGAPFDHHVDASVSDHQTGSHLILRRYKGETNQKKQRGQGRSRKAARSESSKHSITTRTARAEEVADQAGTDFACFISVEPKKKAIAGSRETLPAPKISTIRETIRKMKGAAAINLSGSEKKESSASRSPIT